MNLLKSLPIIALSTLAFTAQAKEHQNPVSISAEIGSLGYGATVGFSVNDSTELQLGYVGGDLLELAGDNNKLETDNADFTASTDLSAPYVGVQLRPFKNWLTVGTGVMLVEDSSINVSAMPVKDLELEYQGTKYIAKGDSAELNANIGFDNPVVPFATLGFRPNVNNRFGLFAEVGTAYTKGLVVDVESKGDFALAGTAGVSLTDAQRAELENSAEIEIRQNLKDNDTNGMNFFPIVKVGTTIRF